MSLPEPSTVSRRQVPWHPLLFAAVVVLTLWFDTAVSPFAAARSLMVAVIGALVLTIIASLILRSWVLGGIVASALIGLAWSKQLIEMAAGLADRMGPAVAALWIGLMVLAVVLIGRLVTKGRHRFSLLSTNSFLNRAAILLLVATLALGFVNGRFGSALTDLDQGVGLADWSGTAVAEPEHPDIYLILLDGYPRADVLQYAFGLDNSSFLDALDERGFSVAQHSHSDYLWTHVSVPSALNMAYVEQIPRMEAVIDGTAPRQPTLRRAIADNASFDLVHERGYDTVAVASGFEEVAARQADVYLDGGELNEFELSLLASTFIGDVVNVVAPDFASGQQRDRIRHNLEVLPEIASTRDRAPAFVFAHVPAPHQPTVFGSDGSGVSVPISRHFYADSPIERGEDRDEFIERYRAQLPYLNQLILEAIDGIIASSASPPIIVLWADHGSASAVDWNANDPGEVDQARLLERTGTLFAALTPDRQDVFPDDISPVNILRSLFDAYFGTDLGAASPPPGGGQVAPIDAAVLDGP